MELQSPHQSPVQLPVQLPRYGTAALADVAPSLLAGMGVPGMTNRLGLPAARRVCLLLVDGLGWELLRAHPEDAPFLSGLASGREPITSGFPSTTAAGLAAVGTGVPPGEHGVVGYSFAVGDELLNALSWGRHGVGHLVDLRSQLVPEEVQPLPTMFDAAAAAGVAVRAVSPSPYRDSGLTRAVLRGADFGGVHALGDLVSGILTALRGHDRIFCYAYHGDVDLLGHMYGPGSDPWRYQLGFVDRLAALVARSLPESSALVVTADHGMVGVTEGDHVDYDSLPDLRAGVRMLGGEPRVRYVYAEPDATGDVVDAWRGILGDRALVLRRDEAIEAGWFGPVSDLARPRIGDVIVASMTDLALVATRHQPHESRLVGHHGSLTPAEQLVPLLEFGAV